MSTDSTTREARAQALIDSGAVTLFVGEGRAEVRGSEGVVYVVTKTSCGCKDFTQRGVEWCKHRLAAKALCAEYRALKAKAAAGERVRPSSALLAAIRWPEKPAPTGCRDCGRPTTQGLCSDCLFGTVAA